MSSDFVGCNSAGSGLCSLLGWLLDIFYYILPSLVTVGVGAFLIQKFFTSRANEAALIDLLVEQLDTIKADSIEYWNLPGGSEENNRKSQILAQKIKGSIKSIGSDLRFYCDRYCLAKKEEIAHLIAEVSDACTGGTFESTNRQIEPARYLFVINSIHRLRSELFRRKL